MTVLPDWLVSVRLVIFTLNVDIRSFAVLEARMVTGVFPARVVEDDPPLHPVMKEVIRVMQNTHRRKTCRLDARDDAEHIRL